MKQQRKTIYVFLSLGLLTACESGMDSNNSFAVAGTYQLIRYETATKSDDDPAGELTIKQLDSDHVSVVIKGVSRNAKIAYSYSSALVQTSGRDEYSLLLKGRTIGNAGNDGVSRYVTITPSPGIVIKAVEF